jgi:uncharacterized protein (TIGR02246 family)
MAMHAVSTEGRGLIPYTNHVVGTVRDAEKAQAAIDALLQAGFRQEDIHILHGEEDLKRFSPTGGQHGFFAQFQQTLIRAFELEHFRHLTHHLEDVRAGRFVIMVLAKRRVQRILSADILNRYGAEFVGFHGRWALEEIPAKHTLPEDTPALFARAWNDRDPNALASLFDKDAELVTASGHWWHDRESIRKAFEHELKGLATSSTLAITDTKVKLLSPEFAMVHARMTRTDQTPAGAATQPASRTTDSLFVVHRTVDRWLCASVHNTDVIPDTGTNVSGPQIPQIPQIDDAGVLGVANRPGGQMA